ncbi:MAG TPA: hypothetical protein VIV54_22150 [Burkholderiales bacterium]
MDAALASARQYHAALEEVLSKSTGGWAAYHAILELRRLCGAAWQLVEDNQCREQLDLIELYATDLFTELKRRVDHGGNSARLELTGEAIRACLDALEHRLSAIERP